EQVLRQVVGAEIVIAFEAQQWPDQFPRQEGVTGLQSGSTRLGKRHGQDDVPIGRIQTLDARQVWSLVAQLPIGGVFQDEDAMLPAVALSELQQVLAARKGQGQAAGILKVIADINEAKAFELPRSLQAGK